jgi:folate-binding protein YgfZ
MLSPAPNPFKDDAMDTTCAPLSGFSLLGCSGPDAAAFLQAQTMNDLRGLVDGQWQWNGWLSAKGRVVCLFALWRRSQHEYLAILPDFPAAELQPLLQRFVFRSKLRLVVEDGLEVLGEFGADTGGSARDFVQAQGPGWRFDFGGDALARALVLVPRDAAAAPDPEFEARWRTADLAHGLPRLDAGQREAWTPQMLSLQRLKAFSLAKGCYPGQEIVARTHYLGQAKRELALLQGQPPSAGAAVTDREGRGLGSVVSTSTEANCSLAVLQADRGPGPFRVGDAEAVEAALEGGLQRPA